MNTKTIIIWVAIIIVVLVGLYFIFKAPAVATQQGQQATNTAATTTPQVQAQDQVIGTGATATPNSVVSVLYIGYIGKISSSTVFDTSSIAHGNVPANTPLTFTIGAPGMISGFQIGVNGMKEGGERLMAIPPELGYGSQDVHQNPKDPNSPVVIPANSTLIFDVKVVKVEAAATTPTPAGKTN